MRFKRTQFKRTYECSAGCGRTRTIDHNRLPDAHIIEFPKTAGFCIYCPDGVFNVRVIEGPIELKTLSLGTLPERI